MTRARLARAHALDATSPRLAGLFEGLVPNDPRCAQRGSAGLDDETVDKLVVKTKVFIEVGADFLCGWNSCHENRPLAAQAQRPEDGTSRRSTSSETLFVVRCMMESRGFSPGLKLDSEPVGDGRRARETGGLRASHAGCAPFGAARFGRRVHSRGATCRSFLEGAPVACDQRPEDVSWLRSTSSETLCVM